MIARSLRGTEGRVTLPGMGALIGEMFNWQLYSEDGKSYILKASCNHLHDSLWEAAGDSRRVELAVQRNNWYVANPIEGASIERNGRNFTIKTVTLEKLEK